MITGNRQKREIGGKAGLRFPIMTSLHSVIICALILVSFCFAFFTEVVQTPELAIQAATYGITAKVSAVSGNEIITVTSGDYSGVSEEDNTVMEVENGKVYEISLTTTDDTSASQGFCIVSAGDVVYHTAPIEKDGTLSFKIVFPGRGTRMIEFIPYWGRYRVEISAGDEVLDGDTISGNH